MNKLLKSWAIILGCWAGILPSGAVLGQESMNLSSYLLTSRDTAEVLLLVSKGNELIYEHTDSALRLFRRAELLSRRSGFSDGLGLSLAGMGLAWTTLGYYAKGFACYHTALPYCQQATKLKSPLLRLYFNMALSWSDQEEYVKANEYFHKVIGLVQVQDPGNAQYLIPVYNNLIGIKANIGSYTQALGYANQAIDLARSFGEKKLLAQVLLSKGDVYFMMKQYDSTLSCYQEAAPLVVAVHDAVLTPSFNHRMGDVLLEVGKFKEALAYLEEARRASQNGRPLMKMMVLYSLGDALYRLGRYPEAEPVVLEAMDLSRKTGLTKNRQNGYLVLIDLYKAQGRYQEALAQQTEYLQLVDSQINEAKIRAVNEIEVKYQVAEKDKSLIQKELQIAQQDKRLYRKNMTIAGIAGGVLLLSSLGVAFYRYQRKISLRDRSIGQLKAMVAGEEKERVRLSRELHDGLGGMVTGIKLKLSSVQREPDPVLLRQELSGIMTMLQGMGEEIRLTAHNLMPDMLVKHRLREALQLYCEQLDTDGQLSVDLQFYGAFQQLDSSLELQVYRMVQELLQNILKHAHARHAAIQIRCDDGRLCVSVEDDGKGFDPGQEQSGLGLRNLEERVKALHGYFSVASSAAMGTTAYLEFPLHYKPVTT